MLRHRIKSDPSSISSSTVSLYQSQPANKMTSVPAPPLIFSTEARSLGQIIQESNLPRVIKCDSETCPGKDSLRLNIDLSQPFLAYQVRTARKASAQSLMYDLQRKDFSKVGGEILIPEDYRGWFAVIGSPNDASRKQKKIPYYPNISTVARSPYSHFLVGDKYELPGFVINPMQGGENAHLRYVIPPGTLLKKTGIYKEQQPIKKGRKKTKGQVHPREFLKCYDEQDREIFINMQQNGAFYVVSKNGRPDPISVVQMPEILQWFELPVIVKLIYGRKPTTPCAFTDVLLLTDSAICQTLIASTLLCYRNINLELPLWTDMKFFMASDTPDLHGSTAYVNALTTCQQNVPTYMKEMKVSFGACGLRQEKMSGRTSEAGNQDSVKQQIPASPDRLQPGYPESPDRLQPGNAGSASAKFQTEEAVRHSAGVTETSPSSKPHKNKIPNRLFKTQVSAPAMLVCDLPVPGITITKDQGRHPFSEIWTQSKDPASWLSYDTSTLPMSGTSQSHQTPPGAESATWQSWGGAEVTNYSESSQDIKHQNSRTTNARNTDYVTMHPIKSRTSDPVPSPKPCTTENRHETSDPVPLPKPCTTENRHETSDPVPSPKPCTTKNRHETSDPVPLPKPCTTENRHETSDPVPSPKPCTTGNRYETSDPVPSPKPCTTENRHETSDPVPPPKPCTTGNRRETSDPVPPPKPCTTENRYETSDPVPSPKPCTTGSRHDLQTKPEIPPVPLLVPPPVPDRRYLSESSLGDNINNEAKDGGSGYEKVTDDEDDDDDNDDDDDHHHPYVNIGPLELQEPQEKYPQADQGLQYNFLYPDVASQRSSNSTSSASSSSNRHTGSEESQIRVNVDDERETYVTPFHVDYRKLRQNSRRSTITSDNTSLVSEHGYVELLDMRHDSGVFEGDITDHYDVDKHEPEIQVDPPPTVRMIKRQLSELATGSSTAKTGSQDKPSDVDVFFTGPQIPPSRPTASPPTPHLQRFGRAVLMSMPAVSGVTFTQANKDMLIQQLRQARVRPKTEIALQGLQLADMTNLLNRKDDFDDVLIALLPQLDRIDLRKIALCFKNMALSL